MSVYNGELDVAASIESVLSQKHVHFELIVVDDGSTDQTGMILNEAANHDNRMLVISQPNKGLTIALKNGCKIARGKYIARIDCGDRYLSNRLLTQKTILDSRPNVGLVSCGTRFLGPKGELLYEIRQCTSQLSTGLKRLEIKEIRGPSHHGSTMFRKSVYISCGGYRPRFEFAQDLDLWLRMSEKSDVVVIEEVLYESTFRDTDISAINRKRQLQLSKIIIECAKLRRSNKVEKRPALTVRRNQKLGKPQARHVKSKYHYFIASCIAGRKPNLAKQYYIQAWRDFPINPMPLLRYLLLLIR